MNESFVTRIISKILYSPNEIALDIGAHHGTYTKQLARKFKKVYAFEPFPDNLVNLKENIKEYNNIEIIQKAISDKSGSTRLYPCPNNTGGNSISSIIAECKTWGHSLENYIDVKTITIDDFLKTTKVSFIKMDIEGAEDFAWYGAINTLKKNKLNIILEVHQKVNTENLFRLFNDLQYTIIQDDGNVVNRFEHDRHYLIYNHWLINYQ